MKVDGWMDVPIICISTWQLHTKRCVCVCVTKMFKWHDFH